MDREEVLASGMTPEPIKTLPRRQDVPQEQTWDIEALYATPDAWAAE